MGKREPQVEVRAGSSRRLQCKSLSCARIQNATPSWCPRQCHPMSHTHLFRLADLETMLIGTERFVDAVLRLELNAVDRGELPLR